MSKLDIDALLKANPKAAEHADSIRKTLKDVNALRKVGIHGAGFDLAPPFGPPNSFGGIAKVRTKGNILTRLRNFADG